MSPLFILFYAYGTRLCGIGVVPVAPGAALCEGEFPEFAPVDRLARIESALAAFSAGAGVDAAARAACGYPQECLGRIVGKADGLAFFDGSTRRLKSAVGI